MALPVLCPSLMSPSQLSQVRDGTDSTDMGGRGRYTRGFLWSHNPGSGISAGFLQLIGFGYPRKSSVVKK